jgi:integrase
MTEAAPTTAIRTLRRLPNATYRPREYLTEAEVERLIEAARKRGRNGARDAAAIFAMGSALRSFANFVGRRLIFGMGDCM